MNNEYELFINECKKNRVFLNYSCKDMANCLVNVSEEDYIKFEDYNYKMSKENLIRIARVLCLKKVQIMDVNNYIDTSELEEEEIKDLSKVISAIVGDENAWHYKKIF